MEQKINEIREILQAADLSELPAFISTYEKDLRTGVGVLVAKARKKIQEYEKEIARTEKMKEFEKNTVHFLTFVESTKWEGDRLPDQW